MKKLIAITLLVCATPAIGCEQDYVREYFSVNGHKYLTVTGYCRGKIQYTVHLQECPCGDGLYEVANGPTQPR